MRDGGEAFLHTFPYAAWAALVALVGGAAPADVAATECVPPDCLAVSHGLIMNPPLAATREGSVVEWRGGGGHHWLVESGTAGGCLAFTTTPERPAYRVGFLVHDGQLHAVHNRTDGPPAVIPCTNAIELSAETFVLRYACALHAREGGVGLLVVSKAPGA